MFCIIGHFSSSICLNAFLYMLLTQFSGVIAPFPVYIGILFVYAIITNKVLMFCFWQAYDIILNVYFLCIVGFGRHEMLILSAIFFFWIYKVGLLRCWQLKQKITTKYNFILFNFSYIFGFTGYLLLDVGGLVENNQSTRKSILLLFIFHNNQISMLGYRLRMKLEKLKIMNSPILYIYFKRGI